MEYWIFIPVILIALGIIGTNLELWKVKKELEQLKQKRKKKK